MKRSTGRAGGGEAIGVIGGDGRVPLLAWLRAGNAAVVEAEVPPLQTSEALARRYGYGFASARCGAMPALRQALQLLQSAVAGTPPKHWLWTDGAGGYLDALRPGIEPACPSKAEVEANRQAHLAAVAGLVRRVGTLVLPLGAAGALVDLASGTAFPPPRPGARAPRGCKPAARSFDAAELSDDFAALRAIVFGLNPGLRIRLLVLPGPDRAALQSLATAWAAEAEGILHNGLLDDLAARLAEPGADPRLSTLFARLVPAADPLQLLAEALAAPPADAPDAAKPSRAERRAARAERKGEGRKEGRKAAATTARLICEDELLEAFS